MQIKPETSLLQPPEDQLKNSVVSLEPQRIRTFRISYFREQTKEHMKQQLELKQASNQTESKPERKFEFDIKGEAQVK